MTRIISFILITLAFICIVIIAVANRESVIFSLDPFNPDTPTFAVKAPLFLVFFAAIGFGILAGGIAAWLGTGPTRRLARQRGRARREEGRGTSKPAPGTQAPSSAPDHPSIP